MFTGLVETTGVVRGVKGASLRRLTIESSLSNEEVVVGDSIAIDGCCLTVVEVSHRGLEFEAATETLARTTLGQIAVGARVNLERALSAGGRLDGHIVTGHVDCVGIVQLREQRGSALYFGVEVEPEVGRLVAARGSIALAGVSLTVTEVRGGVFHVGLIPHTLAATSLEALRVGDPVNVEADILARYVDRLLEARSGGGSLTEEYLKDKGFL
jgi:riboflavin synthase